jgi:hypothetical protein
MELHILACNQRRLPYASLCLYTFAISTPIIDCAKIASCTLHLTHVSPLINCMPEVLKDNLEESTVHAKFEGGG